MKTILSSLTNNEVMIKDLLLIGIYPISFMWYLYALLIITVAQLLIDNIVKKPVLKVAHVILIGGGDLIQPNIATLFETIRFSDCVLNDVLRVYIYFLFGLYGASLLLGKNYRNHVLYVSLTIMLLGNAVLFFAMPKLDYTCGRIVDFIISVSVLISVIEISKKISSRCKISTVLEMIGRNSFPIYLLQGFAIAATRILLSRIG